MPCAAKHAMSQSCICTMAPVKCGRCICDCNRLECRSCIPKLPNPGRVSTGFGGSTSVSVKPGGRARLNSTATKMSSSGVGALTAVPRVDDGWSSAAKASSSHTLYGQHQPACWCVVPLRNHNSKCSPTRAGRSVQQTKQHEVPGEGTIAPSRCWLLLVTLVLKRQRLILWTRHVAEKNASAVASQLFVVT